MHTQCRNNSMDIFRFICALMVIAIHTEPFVDTNTTLGYITVQIIPRIAVPYFFCISGYWYMKKIGGGVDCFKSYFVSILSTYAIWTLIYYTRDLFIYIRDGLNIKGIISTFVINFVLYGSCYHFWYFIALLIAIVVTTLLYKIKNKVIFAIVPIALYIIGLLGSSYYAIGNRIPFISNIINRNDFDNIRQIFCMGIPFFMIGSIIPDVFEKEKSNNTGIKLLINIILFLLEIKIITLMEIEKNVVITIFLPIVLVYTVVLILKHPLNDYNLIGTIAHKLANWIYYIHPIYIGIFGVVIKNNSLLFLIVVIISIATGLFVIKSKKISRLLKIG